VSTGKGAFPPHQCGRNGLPVGHFHHENDRTAMGKINLIKLVARPHQDVVGFERTFWKWGVSRPRSAGGNAANVS